MNIYRFKKDIRESHKDYLQLRFDRSEAFTLVNKLIAQLERRENEFGLELIGNVTVERRPDE